MKKTCVGCRALTRTSPKKPKPGELVHHYCKLGFIIKTGNPFVNPYTPTQECPKPVTWEALNDFMEILKR